MRTRLIVLVIVVLGFLYFRGTRAVLAEQGLKCDHNLIYSVCDTKGKAVKMPGIFEILKAGTKF